MAEKNLVTIYTTLDDGLYSSGTVNKVEIKAGVLQCSVADAEYLLTMNRHAFSKDPKRFPRPMGIAQPKPAETVAVEPKPVIKENKDV